MGEQKTYEAGPGEHIADAAKAIVALAESSGAAVEMTFNGIDLRALPETSPEQIVEEFHRISGERHQAYIQSPEYLQRQQELEIKKQQREAALKDALALAPPFELNDPEKWKSWVDANTDPYGAACVRYAEKWGRLMQSRIAGGEELERCADECSHLADDEGITGFMYGCAVGMLAGAWVHGEQLRRWHNLKTQIRDEGARANESGGVLNPAVITIGEPGE